MPTTPSQWTDASVIKYCLSGYFLAQRTTLVLIQPLGILFLILSFVYVWPCWGFVVAWAFLQPQRVGATLQLQSKGFLLQWSSCCGAWALGQGGFRSCGGTGGSRAQARELSHRLSCSAACAIFLGQGSNLCLLHWQEDSLPLGHQGSPQRSFDKHLHGTFFHPFSFYLLTCDYIWMSFLQTTNGCLWVFFSIPIIFFNWCVWIIFI